MDRCESLVGSSLHRNRPLTSRSQVGRCREKHRANKRRAVPLVGDYELLDDDFARLEKHFQRNFPVIMPLNMSGTKFL